AAAAWKASIDVPLEVNAAMASGRIVFAAIGHEHRLEYTVIGEATNLAAKLEKHNKAEGCRALTTAADHRRAVEEGYAAPAAAEPRPARRVVGVDEPLDLVVLHT
ncbi:MAG: adenylate/guanylate cyclase domain-containing protein, partial [Pseudomonadota bacterium]